MDRTSPDWQSPIFCCGALEAVVFDLDFDFAGVIGIDSVSCGCADDVGVIIIGQKVGSEERIRRQNANRQRIRQIRRERRAKRAIAAKPKRVYVEEPVRTPRRATRSIKRIKAPTFLNYQPEQLVTVDMTGAAAVVAAALATERRLLSAQPQVRQLPVDNEASAPTIDYGKATEGSKAFAKPDSPAGTDDLPMQSWADRVVATINAAASDADELAGAPKLAQVATGADPAHALDRINSAARAGSELSRGLHDAPVFEVFADPRIDQIAAAEEAWQVMGLQSARATKPVAEAVAAHYEASRRLIWTNGERVRPTARRAIATLRQADEYGLEPRDYRVRPMPGPGASLADHMKFELSLTVAVAEYIRDASIGRIVADRISGYHDLPRRDPLLAERLLEIAGSAAPDEVLHEAHPTSREFGILKEELAELREEDGVELPQLPPRIYLRPGITSEHVPGLMTLLKHRASDAILEQHREALDAYDGGQTLPVALDPFVRDVQKQFKLSPDGIVGPKTISRIAGQSNESRVERVLLAMERMRWLPSDLGEEYVFINQPAFRVQHVVGDDVNLSMRVVVGKPANQTNFFYDTIEHIEFNPDWGVPRSIIVNEMLPRLQNEPGYLDRIGYEVRNSRGKRVASANVNWWKYGSDVPYTVTQPPGPRNALGELKIEFPNRHLIYMHDTPAKKLFNRTERAYSHGCVRLHDPRAMAAAVLGTDLNDVRRRIRKGHHNAPIDRDLPVYVSYFTAWPTDEGEIGYYSDIYGRDNALKKALEKTRNARSF